DGLRVLPTQSEIHGEIPRHLPVVLNEDRVAPMAMAPFPDHCATAFRDHTVQKEVAVRNSGIRAIESEDPESAVVSRVVAILPITHKLGAELEEVRTLLPGQFIAIRNAVIALTADRAAGADAAQSAAQRNRTQTRYGLAAADTELGVPIGSEQAAPIDW